MYFHGPTLHVHAGFQLYWPCSQENFGRNEIYLDSLISASALNFDFYKKVLPAVIALATDQNKYYKVKLNN